MLDTGCQSVAQGKGGEEMKEHPILFSGPMVRAILECRKTQTRRIVKNPPAYPGVSKFSFEKHPFAPSAMKGTPAEKIKIAPEKNIWVYEDWCGNIVGILGDCQYGQPGDRLWVREKFSLCDARRPDGNPCVLYSATSEAKVKWKPSIHMPRWASRITLEITNVKVERLNDISEEDAKAEGVDISEMMELEGDPEYAKQNWNYRTAFKLLWQNIHSMKSWNENPWVWVVGFKKMGAV